MTAAARPITRRSAGRGAMRATPQDLHAFAADLRAKRSLAAAA
jgi:hypothetical protein